MVYEQQTALFRVEERSTAFVAASLANVAITIAATVLLVVVWEQGALGVVLGNIAGTLAVTALLLRRAPRAARPRLLAAAAPRDEPLRHPLVPAALALIAVNFSTASSSCTSPTSRRWACTRSASASPRRWCCC